MGVIILVVVVLAVAALVLGALAARRRPRPARSDAAPGVVSVEPTRPRPAIAEFLVRGNQALVHFEVPLPEGEVDEVLRELLLHEAIEVVRDKRHDLPIGEVTEVVALGRRDGAFAEVGVVSLSTPGELPPPAPPQLMRHAARAGLDILEQLEGDLPQQAPGLAPATKAEELAPLHEELRIPGPLEAGLRTQGIDPGRATAGDLLLGILRFTGYSVSPADREGSYLASKAGQRTYVNVVEHVAGDYPELGERAIQQFCVDFISSGTDRGLLVTEKYGPFEVYERERRDPRMRFITRERLQHFIDALALG